MANPFTVQPLGGLQGFQQIQQGMQGIAQQSQLNQQEEQQAAIQAEAQRLMQSGSPQEIAAFSAANPQIGEAMRGATKFANEATEKNMQESMQRIIAGEDPAQVIQDRVSMVQANGGDPRQSQRELEMLQQMGPEQYRKMISNVYAMRYGDEGVPGASGGPNIGTYNPRDYTTDSFAEFARTNDPSVLERYTGRTIDVGGVPYREMPDGTLRRLQIPGGAAGEPTQEVTTETVAESEAEITRAGEQAKQDVKSQSPEQVRKQEEAIRSSRMNVANTQDVVRQVDDILNNQDYIDSISGVRGKLPAIPGTGGFDADIAFDRLKNTLTLGNLDKMSGVLSESDIKILQSAAGGLESGMSEESLRKRLQEVRSVFQSKTEEERQKLSEMMSNSSSDDTAGGMSDSDADALIDSILGQ